MSRYCLIIKFNTFNLYLSASKFTLKSYRKKLINETDGISIAH